jgi:hypothetical protein
MPFDAAVYGDEIASILALDGDGERLMPLARSGSGMAAARRQIESLAAPAIVKAGLYLYHSLWDEAHETAQDIATPEGSYWHAIVHRQEPDEGNAGYWFRQVGAHPIFPALRDRAAGIGLDFGPRWNPFQFIEYCERARERAGSGDERKALETQRAEWQLLFDHCNSRGA